MDASSVVSSLSINRSLEFIKRSPCNSGSMVQKRWSGSGGGGDDRRRLSTDQRSEVSTCADTDLSAERPCTRDTSTLFMRDASVLSGQPDKSNFREKLQNWTVYEDTSSPYMAPRPTTSLSSQKPGTQLNMITDIDREMSFLMSRSSTGFPVKPKELVEPLEGLMPEERPVSQKKFLVLPSIGHPSTGDFFLRRQRSNLETVNQLDYSRQVLEHDVQFFSDYYHHPRQQFSPSLQQQQQQYHHDPSYNQPWRDSPDRSGSNSSNPRESPTKAGKLGTPMPLPPIHKMKWERLRLAGLEEENPFGLYSNRESCFNPSPDDDDEDDEDDEDNLDQFRLKTPETLRTLSPATRGTTVTPPHEFR